MPTTDSEKLEERFREAVRRLDVARALPSQKARRAERQLVAEFLKLIGSYQRVNDSRERRP